MVYQCLSYFIFQWFIIMFLMFFSPISNMSQLVWSPGMTMPQLRGFRENLTHAKWTFPSQSKIRWSFPKNFRPSSLSSFFFPKFFCNSLNLQTRYKAESFCFSKKTYPPFFPGGWKPACNEPGLPWRVRNKSWALGLDLFSGDRQWNRTENGGEDKGFLWISKKNGRRSAPKGSYMGS